jgi:hypothetical protein
MKVYLARLNAAQEHPGEIVGLFFARNVDELHELIDGRPSTTCEPVVMLAFMQAQAA